MHLEAHVLDDIEVVAAFDAQVLDVEHDITKLRRLFIDDERHVAADHQVRHLLRRGRRDVQHVHQFPAAQNRAAVGDLLDFLELVGNQDDRLAAVAQRAQDFQ